MEAHGAARLAEQAHFAGRAAEVSEIAFTEPLDGHDLVYLCKRILIEYEIKEIYI